MNPAGGLRQALQALQNCPENEALALEVSHLFRRYVTDALELQHEEFTTPEFEAAVRAHPQGNEELAAAVGGWLRDCDVKKFAPVKPPAPLNLAARALELVQRIEKLRRRSPEPLRVQAPPMNAGQRPGATR